MIVIIHSLYFAVKFVWRWYRRQQIRRAIRLTTEQQKQEALSSIHKSTAVTELDPEECFVFSTPVYRQRYTKVQDILLDSRWRKDIQKVVDFGCAEFGFFQYLKHLIGVSNIMEVDIDETLLKENMYRVQPLTADYLKQRSNPLTVEIFRGSICDPDWRIKGVDAIVGIEIIEHLYPDTLDALPYNIFGYAQPKLAIFTTPNADFNVLFPNFKGFRHDDHKFEWSREQFEDWGRNIVSRFPNYSVTFEGIGSGPRGTESLGCCSQMALFIKEYHIIQSEIPEASPRPNEDEENKDWRSFGVCTYYSFTCAQIALLHDDLQVRPTSTQLGIRVPNAKRPDEYFSTVEVIKYPYEEDDRSPDEKLLLAAQQQIFRHTTPMSRYYNEDTGIVEIPLYEVVRNFEGPFTTEAEIKVLLEAADFKIAECTLFGTDERCLCVQYDIDMADHTSRSSDYEASIHLEETEHDDDDAWNADHPHTDNDTLDQRNLNTSHESDWEFDERAVRLNQIPKDETATPSDPLVDSGYQKSLSNAEWSPQSPIDGHFDEQFMPKMDVNDIKDSIKARMAQTHNGKVMNNRVLSEWRRFSGGSGVKFPSTATAPLSMVGAVGSQLVKSPTAGTSRRRKTSSYGRRSESEDSGGSAKEDVKSIADVLVYNSLNKLNIVEPLQVEQVVLPVERPQDLEIPQFIVENGDLANNNRDGEGNNYPEVEPPEPVDLVDLGFDYDGDDPNENVQHPENPDIALADQNEDQENRNVRFNIDDGIVADVPIDPEENELVPVLEIIDVHPPGSLGGISLIQDGDEDEEEINHASREALFDPNSQSDLLEDGSLTDGTVEFETGGEVTDADPASTEESVTPANSLFPRWLLQLLGGAHYESTDADAMRDGPLPGEDDEPHFYCQGDGLGVHPSIVDIDIDTSSSSASTDEAVAEHTISENDVGSLPADGVSNADNTVAAAAALAIFGRALDIPFVLLEQTSSNISQDSAGEEFFDTVADQTPLSHRYPPDPPQDPDSDLDSHSSVK